MLARDVAEPGLQLHRVLGHGSFLTVEWTAENKRREDLGGASWHSGCRWAGFDSQRCRKISRLESAGAVEVSQCRC